MANGTAGLVSFLPTPSLASVTISIHCPLCLAMLTAQVLCHRCSKLFVPCGLSQHVSKSWDPQCWSVLRTSQAQVLSSSSQHIPIPLLLTPDQSVPISKDGKCSGPMYDAEGAFATIHCAFSRLLSHSIIDDTTGFNDISIERPDHVDLADADVLLDLLYSSMPELAHDQPTSDEDSLDLAAQPNQTGANLVDYKTVPTVEVEHFPFGRPGVPIPGRAEEPFKYKSQASFTSSPWAPFQSQLEWDVAHWAKLHGGTSTAVSKLLAIPGVHTYILISVLCL